MLVPDEVRRCVVFFGYRDRAGTPELAGTGFFFGSELGDFGFPDRSAAYLVTAQHVIDKIREKGGRGLVRINAKGGKAQWLDFDPASFYSHPNHPAHEAVDLAVMPVGLSEDFEYLVIPTSMCLTPELASANRVGLGDEVFISGLFWNHHGRERNLPIVRIGNIAGMPEEKVRTNFGDIDAYLVEARSIGGLSGSPVFVHLGMTRVIDGQVKFAQNSDTGIFYLLGIMQGHWDSNSLLSIDEGSADGRNAERVNMGIAIVTPVSKLLETVKRSEMEQHRRRIAEHTREAERRKLPSEDALSPANQEEFTRGDFESALKRVSRKLSDEEKSET